MEMTLAEKILANKTGREVVRPGEIVEVGVDAAEINDTFTALILPVFERFGRPVWDKEKVGFSVCHFPAYSVRAATNIKQLRDFCKRQEIKGFFPHGGPSSLVLVDHGFVYPGAVVVATDSHTTTGGAFGAFATGIGSTEMVSVLLTGRIWFKVPSTIKFEINGELRPGIMAKDLILKMISLVGVEGANYKAVEYAGETVRNMEIDGRMVLANMAVEMGAKVGLVVADEKTVAYIKKRTDKPFQLLQPDNDAQYEAVIPVNANELEPMLACPHNPGNVKPVSQVEPVKLDMGFIGSCTGGHMEDLRQAARVLEEKRVHPDVQLIVIPVTVQIYNQALDEGLVSIFAKAGAVVEYANCGPCVGMHMGVLAPGEVCVSAGNRNFPGRMGSEEARIYLASPATVAASAIEGKIADPRKYL